MKTTALMILIFVATTTSFGQVRSLDEALIRPLEIKHLNLTVKDRNVTFSNLLKLPNLEILEISVEPDIDIKLPYNLYELKNLKKISLQGTDISQVLFNHLGKYQNLNELYINDRSKNISFPEKPIKLSHLNLVLEEINTIDGTIGNLNTLASLSINSSSIRNISDSISKLTKLKNLSIRCENLQSIPEGISEIKDIEKIDLYIKSSVSLPENFNKLENIKEFRWGQCRQFPTQIYKCKNLESLIFDESYFDSIPVGISRLSNLRKLNLSFGVFQVLPNDFNQLISIVELELTGSEIIKLPEKLSNLKLLRGIDLQYCKNLKDAENVIISLKSVENLEWLIISNSGLTEEKQVRIKTELGLQN